MKASTQRTEMRIYQPRLGKAPGQELQPFVGKIVTVKWHQPVFMETHSDSKGNKLWIPKWFGWVAEMDRLIPGEELLPLLQPLEGTTK